MSDYREIQSGKGCLLSIIILIVLSYVIYSNVNYYGLSFKNWDETEGLITSYSEHKTNRSCDASIKYKYEVDGETYESDKINCNLFGTNCGYSEIYPLGKKVTVYYDPSAPQKALLEITYDLNEIYLIIFIVFICFISFFVFRMLRRKAKTGVIIHIPEEKK